MPILPENPCADGHPELALMTLATTLLDDLPVMVCNRCGERLSFEDAVRNDERLKIAQAIQALHDRLDETDVWENEGRGYLAEAVGIVRGSGHSDD